MDTSPTALFDSYEQDFIQFIETIRERLQETKSDDVNKNKSNLGRVERDMDEADEMAISQSSPSPSNTLIPP